MARFINHCCSNVSSGNITFDLWWAWGTPKDDHKRCLFFDDTAEDSYCEGLSDWDPLRLGCWHLRDVCKAFSPIKSPTVVSAYWFLTPAMLLYWHQEPLTVTFIWKHMSKKKKSWIKWSQSDTHANEQQQHNRVKLCTRDTVLPRWTKGFLFCCGPSGLLNA